MASERCECGAFLYKHPSGEYSPAGACLQALKAHHVKVLCDWPGCEKSCRKWSLGHNFCPIHHRLERGAFLSLVNQEGPQTLNRPLPTLIELEEYARTRQIPASRQAPVSFDTTQLQCGLCGGPLVMFNGDWYPGAPATRDSDGTHAGSEPWGVGICRCCSTPECRHCLWRGEMRDGHTPDASGHCTRCQRHVRASAA